MIDTNEILIQTKFLIIFSSLVFLIIFWFILLSFFAQNQGQLLISDIRNKEDSISDSKLSISGLNHISSDLNFAQSDLYNLAETEKTLNNFWDDVLNKENISLNWKKKVQSL